MGGARLRSSVFGQLEEDDRQLRSGPLQFSYREGCRMNDPTIERLFVRHEPRQADLALVFGYHVPTGAAARARHAARLYHQGVVPRLLFTGGAPHGPGQVAEAVRMAHVAMEAGVPASAILIEPDSDNTFQNVVFSREMLETLGLLAALRRVLVVSCAWHMGRIVRVMKKCF